ncbi:MAG: DUF3025 domain-containing protein [Chromatiales bacterium]|nr:DUF3025 domain-containing protein [Chromatiales bacterium]
MGTKTNTRIDAMVPWHGDFPDASPLFSPIGPQAERFRDFTQWPELSDLQRVLEQLEQPIRLLSGKVLKIVAQDERPEHFEDHYAPRIYFSGELQTRSENWHDFFQYQTWLIFPHAKAAINAIHIPQARMRLENGGDIGRRTPLENMLSLFDEGGAVLLSSDNSLLQLVRDFRWKVLFWQRRDELAEHFECITFGHAMYEKALAPYTGMTANTILLHVAEDYFRLSQAERLAYVDKRLAAIFIAGSSYRSPQDLQPFPILGMPGWDSTNSNESYYENTHYFRPGRRR